ncbi:MAG: transporter substrate-binding protein, partial [Paenibacillus sp.]|nr:transporter substrate-binding protein [Paenibacillus sp.]
MNIHSNKLGGRALFSFFAASMLLAAGCSSGGSSTGGDGNKQTAPEKTAPEQAPEKLEPVTITMFNNAGSIKQQMDDFVKAPVEKKYPHITLNILYSTTGATLKDLVAANQAPDMVYGLLDDSQYKLMMDLAPLIAKNKFDVNAIKPRLWEYANYFTGSAKIQNIPFLTSQHVMYYNKSIFDKFGVGYPKDGMTWDETYELAKKVTRTENG